MKDYVGDWYICDICGYTRQRKDFVLTGFLDVCDKHRNIVGNLMRGFADAQSDGMKKGADTYQQLAKRTLIDKPPFELNDEQIMLTWNALGLTGEAGEVAESIKKGIYHQHGLDVAKLTNELGDVLWYVAALCSILHVDMSSIMQQNIDKLKARYPNGFNSQDSIKRIDTHTL